MDAQQACNFTMGHGQKKSPAEAGLVYPEGALSGGSPYRCCCHNALWLQSGMFAHQTCSFQRGHSEIQTGASTAYGQNLSASFGCNCSKGVFKLIYKDQDEAAN
jgi:hypothetical protein